MIEILRARLDRKTGYRVLCGKSRCDGEIAHIRAYEQEAEKDNKPVMLTLRFIVFSAGWGPGADGVWELTAHARRRVRAGVAPKFRRSNVARGARLHAEDVGVNEVGLPVEARCPVCEWRNRLDQQALGVEQSDNTWLASRIPGIH